MGRCVRFPDFGGLLAAAVVLVLSGAAVAQVAEAQPGGTPWVATVKGAGIPTAVQVSGSSPESVRFSVSGLVADWSEEAAGSGKAMRWSLSIDGFVSGGAPGEPRVPSSGSWLVVPPGTRPELRVIRETWQSAGGRPLVIETMPVEVPARGDEPASLQEILVLPGEPLPDGLTALPGLAAAPRGRSGSAVTIDKVSWWRGRRVAAYRIVPVRHDASGFAGETLVDGEWEIRFVPDKADALEAPKANLRMRSGANDVRFAGAFLNGELLSKLPPEGSLRDADFEDLESGERARRDGRGGKAVVPLGPEARLAVTRTGPVRVTYSRLRQRGLIPADPIAENQIRLYQRRYLSRLDTGTGKPYVEIEVPIHVVGEGDNFDGDDFFVFHGLRLRDDGTYVADLGTGPETVPGCGDPFEMNNAANLYWLACVEPAAGEPWARMATAPLAAAVGAPLPSFRHQAHVEEQGAFRENLPTVGADRLYLNLHTDTEASVALSPFWKPDPAGAPVDISLSLAGFNNGPWPIRFELVTGTSNITVLDEFNLVTSAETRRNYVVPASAIDGPTTKVRMTGRGGTDLLFAFLNWAEFSYDALYTATGNQLRFHTGNVEGARPVEVTGFTTADIGLLEITDPRAPVFVRLEAGNVVADGATWKLSVMPNQASGTRTFHAIGGFSGTGVSEFVTFESSLAANVVDPTLLSGPSPDLIVVTHPEFRGALDRWVQHRIARSGGSLKVHVVDVNDLYDWYSGGLRDPWAIKRFCNHALSRWESWSLVVVGDANENALGKRVLSMADAWAKDWVPTHYHVQRALSYTPELMASDKWYTSLVSGRNYPVEDFPYPTTQPYDMLTGRLPCNSVAELNVIIDKIIALETPQPGQDWRRRGIFVADDEWSNGYGAEAILSLSYRIGEDEFLKSERDSLATVWASGTGVPLESSLVSLKALLDPQFPYIGSPTNPNDRPLAAVRDYTAVAATPVLLAALNQGGIIANYQGHANHYVLSSEYWLWDRPTAQNQRNDTALLTNTGRPWFFIGLGCHISDWAQNPAYTSQVPQERGLSEKLLLRPAAGASATYASSGFEFIVANRVFAGYIYRRWTLRPPAVHSVGPGANVDGRSRWVLGELMWAAEADLQAARGLSYPYGEMIAQYVLLGDPLMTLDGGEPVVTATLSGAAVSGAVDLPALDETNLRVLTVAARDEAGIDRLEIVDENGNDVAGQMAVEVLPPGAQTHQRVDYTLTVPVRPYDHALTVRVYDTGAALAADRHWELVLNMPQTAVFLADGVVLDPQTFAFDAGTPVAFAGTVTTSAWLTPAMTLALTSDTLELSHVNFNLNKGLGLTVDFTAAATAAASSDGHSVLLAIDGHLTEFVLQGAPATADIAGIGRVFNFPNPMGASTRFILETGIGAGPGTISIWSVAGSPVARVGFAHPGGDGIVEWDGRDNHGDRLANGTYLYRVEITGPQGAAQSEMQRLVIMR